MSAQLPDVHFGNADSPPAKWRGTDDPDIDDELIETPEYVIKMLGFDPAKETDAAA